MPLKLILKSLDCSNMIYGIEHGAIKFDENSTIAPLDSTILPLEIHKTLHAVWTDDIFTPFCKNVLLFHN